MSFKRIITACLLAALVASCSTKKNTVMSRGFHNLTARFNGLYYSTESIKEGVYKIEKSNKDDFDKLIPVYIYPTSEKAKATFPEFDKAIKKSSLCIQKHAIKDSKGNEIASSGKWIDDNWINIGTSHFYKRELFSAIETFEYVARTYKNSEDKYRAIIWLIKINNEIGAVSSSEGYLSLIKNETKLPTSVKNEFPVAYADYYIRRGQYNEAMAKLMQATRNSSLFFGISKNKRARYSFLVGQLAEMQKDNSRAIQYYTRTIQLKPTYEMIFYSKIKVARLMDVSRTNSLKTKKDLLKMAKETKNSEYYDVIYYTLGEIEEKEKNITEALSYYKKSVRASVANPKQKALSYLKLAEINFDLTNYQPASSYYDSTIASLPSDHPDYKNIVARKKTLESLVTQIKTITKEDSLQRLAKMSESERNVFIEKMIAANEKEEERKRQEQEEALNQPSLPASPIQALDQGAGLSPSSFPFYTPSTLAFGVADFSKKWGNRKLEDNWRRSNKTVVLQEEKPDQELTKVVNKDSLVKEKKSISFYLKDLPMNDSAMTRSNNRIIRAYYKMGSIYKEELNNTKKTISTFEELNSRFPDNKYTLNTYYSLYRIYLQEKNIPKADYYKNKILTEFPDSEFAMLIKNPDYAKELSAQKSEVENFYNNLYNVYHENDYTQSYTLAKEGISQFGKSEYLPKFEFIKAMSSGKLKGVDTLEQNLKLLVVKYPNSEVTPFSQDVLAAIKKQKTPEVVKPADSGAAKKDTFTVKFESPHFVIAITPDNAKVVETLRTNIGNFNTVFYNSKTFEISANLFGSNQMIIIKSFANAKEALGYYENLIAEPELYSGDVKKGEVEFYPISADNLPTLYKLKNAADYKFFYGKAYKDLKSGN